MGFEGKDNSSKKESGLTSRLKNKIRTRSENGKSRLAISVKAGTPRVTSFS